MGGATTITALPNWAICVNFDCKFTEVVSRSRSWNLCNTTNSPDIAAATMATQTLTAKQVISGIRHHRQFLLPTMHSSTTRHGPV